MEIANVIKVTIFKNFYIRLLKHIITLNVTVFFNYFYVANTNG